MGNGAFIHYDGRTWMSIAVPLTVADLNAVWTVAGDVFAVGVGGTVARLSQLSVTCGGGEVDCGDYWDNDCDDLTDACDPDCAGLGPAEQCANARDDDCDGFTDCADLADCAFFPTCP